MAPKTATSLTGDSQVRVAVMRPEPVPSVASVVFVAKQLFHFKGDMEGIWARI